jgi:hypothetical protein
MQNSVFKFEATIDSISIIHFNIGSLIRPERLITRRHRTKSCACKKIPLALFILTLGAFIGPERLVTRRHRTESCACKKVNGEWSMVNSELK